MFTSFKKGFLICLFTLVVLATGALQSNSLAFAAGQNEVVPETPLYPGLTWDSIGVTNRNITLNVKGDITILSGDTYQATEQFVEGLPQDILAYYSNSQLAMSGWSSYDAFDGPDGVHQVFYHEAGMYLSVEFLQCDNAASSTCITVWIGKQTDDAIVIEAISPDPNQSTNATTAFTKKNPANGATGLNPASITLSWNEYSPTPEKYSYCVKAGSPCDETDPNWTGTYTNTSITINTSNSNQLYYWQVKAITCASCHPKEFVLADNGSWWTFTTALVNVNISGNAGTIGATLNYFDGIAKTVLADGSGNYLFTVPYGWTGTITPSKSGYIFSPTLINITTPVTASLPNQNFSAKRFAAADFNGDGKTDVGVWRPLNGTWYIYGIPTVQYGGAGDIPVPGDYNGDGKTDVAIFRPSNGMWYGKDQFGVQYGGAGDIPVPGDYNGDGKTDVAVFRPSNGTWYIYGIATVQYGGNGDIPVPSDYDGDGRTDVAVFRPSNGIWYIYGIATVQYGGNGDIPVPGDYNGDGRTDVAVFRPLNGTWYIYGVATVQYGGNGDIPVPGDYNGDKLTDVAVYRPTLGYWYIYGQYNQNWGVNGDFPLPARDTNGDGDPYQSQE